MADLTDTERDCASGDFTALADELDREAAEKPSALNPEPSTNE